MGQIVNRSRSKIKTNIKWRKRKKYVKTNEYDLNIGLFIVLESFEYSRTCDLRWSSCSNLWWSSELTRAGSILIIFRYSN